MSSPTRRNTKPRPKLTEAKSPYKSPSFRGRRPFGAVFANVVRKVQFGQSPTPKDNQKGGTRKHRKTRRNR